MKTTFDENDPRLTAFALGELKGDEREQLEKLVGGNESAREAVDEIRDMAKMLGEGFAEEPQETLSEEQVQEILEGSAESNIIRTADGFSRFSRVTAIAAVAACLAVVAGVGIREYFESTKAPSDLVEAHNSAGKAPSGEESTSTEPTVADATEVMEADDAKRDLAAGGTTRDEKKSGEEKQRLGTRAHVADKQLKSEASDPAKVAPKPSLAIQDEAGALASGSATETGDRKGKAGAVPQPPLVSHLRDAKSKEAGPARRRMALPRADAPEEDGVAAADSFGASPANEKAKANSRGNNGLLEFAAPMKAEEEKETTASIAKKRKAPRTSPDAAPAPEPPAVPSATAQPATRPPVNQFGDGYLYREGNSQANKPVDRNGRRDALKSRGVTPDAGRKSGQSQSQGAPGERRKQVDYLEAKRSYAEAKKKLSKLQEDYSKKTTGKDAPDGASEDAAGLSQQIQQQQADLENSRVKMLKMMEKHNITDLEGSTPGWLRGDQEATDAKDLIARSKQQEELRKRVVRTSPGESYAPLVDNPFKSTWNENVSTFSIDVDTGSYSNTRRFVMQSNQLPPKDAVRIEEMINYFDYKYPQPEEADQPFSVNLEVASCPWKKEHRLLRIGLKGKEMHRDKRPPSNLVFLIDVSGSMNNAAKLPLLKKSMIALADSLNEDDSISIVVYAGNSGLVLEPTSGDLKDKIKEALERLRAGGSTNGGAGIQLAYDTAKQNFIEGGVNRVILATDGDFNVGVTNTNSLISMVEERAKEDHIFLTVLGFGTGNIKEDRMEQIADKGNSNYFYIDREQEGCRVLVEKLSSTLVAIAKDVKIQVEFNPGKVAKYRLIGYANRMLKNEDFDDDTKDAGEIGAGHTVTALYEILPVGPGGPTVDDVAKRSKYLSNEEEIKAKMARLVKSEELVTVRLRHKKPDEDTSKLMEEPLVDPGLGWAESSEDFRFAAAVAGYGMLLRDSEYKGGLNYDLVLELAEEGIGEDEHGLRPEFVDLVKRSQQIAGK